MDKVVILARVSTDKQEYQRQVNELTDYCSRVGWNVEATFCNKISGAKSIEERSEIQDLIKFVQEHEISRVVCLEISRLGRNTLEALKVIECLNEHGVSLFVKNYNLETLNPDGKVNPVASLICTILLEIANMERLTTYCASKGYTIIEPIQDDYSAKDYNLVRPGLKKIYDYCKKHRGEVDKVLFLRWDRFTRNVEFAMTYKRKFYDEMGIEINAIENPIDFNTPEWATLFPLYCGVAHTEDEKISRRTKDGIHGTLLKGKWPHRAPLGYLNVRRTKHDCWIEVDPDTGPLVQRLFSEVALGQEVPT